MAGFKEKLQQLRESVFNNKNNQNERSHSSAQIGADDVMLLKNALVILDEILRDIKKMFEQQNNERDKKETFSDSAKKLFDDFLKNGKISKELIGEVLQSRLKDTMSNSDKIANLMDKKGDFLTSVMNEKLNEFAKAAQEGNLQNVKSGIDAQAIIKSMTSPESNQATQASQESASAVSKMKLKA